jgi:hypothetical protein
MPFSISYKDRQKHGVANAPKKAKPIMFGGMNNGIMPVGMSKAFGKPTVKTMSGTKNIEVRVIIPTGMPNDQTLKPLKQKSWMQQMDEW